MSFLKYFTIGLISTFLGMTLTSLWLGSDLSGGIKLMFFTPFVWLPVNFINASILTYADYKANYYQPANN